MRGNSSAPPFLGFLAKPGLRLYWAWGQTIFGAYKLVDGLRKKNSNLFRCGQHAIWALNITIFSELKHIGPGHAICTLNIQTKLETIE